MAKLHADTDVSLVIEFTGKPRYGTFFLGGDPKTGPEIEARKLRMADEFEKLITRHIAPHFSGDFSPRVARERRFVCEGCGSVWTEKSDTYNGGCCSQDEDDEIAARAANGQFGVGA